MDINNEILQEVRSLKEVAKFQGEILRTILSIMIENGVKNEIRKVGTPQIPYLTEDGSCPNCGNVKVTADDILRSCKNCGYVWRVASLGEGEEEK